MRVQACFLWAQSARRIPAQTYVSDETLAARSLNDSDCQAVMYSKQDKAQGCLLAWLGLHDTR